MVSVEEQFRAAMLADSTVFGLVGQRIYLQAPQNVEPNLLPFIELTLVSDVPLYSHERSASQGTVAKARLQVAIWGDQSADSQKLAESISRAVASALQTFSAYDLPTSPHVVHGAPNFIVLKRGGIEPNTQPPIFKRILDIMLWHQDQ